MSNGVPFKGDLVSRSLVRLQHTWLQSPRTARRTRLATPIHTLLTSSGWELFIRLLFQSKPPVAIVKYGILLRYHTYVNYSSQVNEVQI